MEIILGSLLLRSALDCNNYSSTLIGWAYNPNTPDGLSIAGIGYVYGENAVEARRILIEVKGWETGLDEYSNSPCRKDELQQCEVNPDQLIIYPNPSTSIFNIQLTSDLKSCSYRMSDIKGAILTEGIIENEILKLEIENYGSGLYFLQIGPEGMNPPLKLLKL